MLSQAVVAAHASWHAPTLGMFPGEFVINFSPALVSHSWFASTMSQAGTAVVGAGVVVKAVDIAIVEVRTVLGATVARWVVAVRVNLYDIAPGTSFVFAHVVLKSLHDPLLRPYVMLSQP